MRPMAKALAERESAVVKRAYQQKLTKVGKSMQGKLALALLI
jgi:hypothetical protein